MSDENLSEAEKKFLAFDWSKSKEWQTYFSNLYPTPDASKVPKFKRTWFRRNVDSTLSLESTVGDPVSTKKETTTTTTKPEASSSTSSFASTASKWASSKLFDRFKDRPKLPLLQEFVLRMELVLMLGYLLSTMVVVTSKFKAPGSESLVKNCETVSKSFCVLYLLTGLFREKGRPKFSTAWFSSVSNDNRVHYLMYGLFFLPYPVKFVFSLPQLMTALLYLSSMYKSYPYIFPRLLQMQKVKEFLGKVEQNKYHVLKFRGYLECAMVPYLLLCMVLGKANMVPLFLYFSFLRLKVHSKDVYVLNTFKTLHMYISNSLNNPKCPPRVRNLYHRGVKGLQFYFTGRRG